MDYANRATNSGIAAYKDMKATGDNSVVANLRAAGAVIVGRTSVPALSMRRFTENALYGQTNNPYDIGITVGRSSGGAAAVAVSIGPVAHGNDIGGSIRYPAYCLAYSVCAPPTG